jgi:hypothetical protein
MVSPLLRGSVAGGVEQIEHRRLDARHDSTLDRNSGQHSGHGLRARGGVAKRRGVTLGVLLGHDLAVAGHGDTRDLSVAVQLHRRMSVQAS